jgi:multidrug efflux pump subunit AcrB
MLVTIGLVYKIMVILFGSLLVPFVMLSTLIGLLMPRGIVVTNATVLRDFAPTTGSTRTIVNRALPTRWR